MNSIKCTLLDIFNLNISYITDKGEAKAVSDVELKINYGEILGIAGESGSGKTTLAYSVTKLLDNNCKVISGEVLFENADLLGLTEKQMRTIRGDKIGMVFQNPMSSLNPVYTVGNQIIEAVRCHRKISKKEAKEKAVNMLKTAGLENAEKIMRQYPLQLSGGMIQRAMIAMALICSPKLLIADEPTTALDATVQAQILGLIKAMQSDTNMSVMLITHNLIAVARVCDRIAVMYGGRIVEIADTDDIFTSPAHPYTKGLIDCMPDMDAKAGEKLKTLHGEPANIYNFPKGCEYSARCTECMKICIKHKPPQIALSPNHKVSCWMYLKGGGGTDSE